MIIGKMAFLGKKGDLSRATIAAAAVVLFFEVFVFNFPFWESLSFGPASDERVSSYSGMTCENGIYTITDPDDAAFDISIPYATVNNIHFKTSSTSFVQTSPISAGETYSLTVFVQDEGNKDNLIDLGTVSISENISSTQYLRIHPAGDVKEVRLQLHLSKGSSFAIDALSFNSHRPFQVSWLRVLIMAFAALILVAFRPSSSLFHKHLDLKDKSQKFLIALFFICCAAVIAGVSQLIIPSRIFDGTYLTENGAFINDDNQYNHLADSILAGKVSLDLPVPEWLPSMDNPHDAHARAQLSQATGEPTYWDYAFYNGSYYSYFGALPALLTFVPYKLLTGHDLRTDIVVVLFCWTFIASSMWFIYRLMRRYMQNASLGFYFTSSLLLIVGSGILTQAFLPKIYSIPILSALTFTFSGLAFWLNASSPRSISKQHLVAGAVCLAATLGCRPQFILASTLAFPIFYNEIKQRIFFSRKSLANTLSIITPFLIIGSAAMAYNQARFGSFFDFGASYNLTGFDMTQKSFSLSLLPWGTFLYLFQPLMLEPNFPFIATIPQPSSYLGQFIMEPFFGGFFAFAPAALSLFAIGKAAPGLKRNHLYGFCLISILLGLLIMIIDMQVASISMRYIGDFGWYFIISSLCVFYFSSENAPLNIRKALSTLFVALTLVGIFVAFWNLLSDGRYGELIASNNTLYRMVQSWFTPLM